MADNPYAIAAGRYFQIFLGVTGAFFFASTVIRCISSGRAYGPWRYNRIVGEPYTAATNPSQFWLLVIFYAAMVVLFALLAWRAYRE